MYSVRMVFTVTSWCFDFILLYVSNVMFRGSGTYEDNQLSCMFVKNGMYTMGHHAV
jgi:hypothetical protein